MNGEGVGGPGCRTNSPERILEKGEAFLHAMVQLETRQLELASEVAHIFARSRQQIDAALGQRAGLGLRERAPIADDDPVLHPAREGIGQFVTIHGGGGQSKPAEPLRLITLHMQLEAIPPAHPVLGLARPGLKVRR